MERATISYEGLYYVRMERGTGGGDNTEAFANNAVRCCHLHQLMSRTLCSLAVRALFAAYQLRGVYVIWGD